MRPRGNTQEDYLLRIIRQAAELLRQMRRRLLGGEDAAEASGDAAFAARRRTRSIALRAVAREVWGATNADDEMEGVRE